MTLAVVLIFGFGVVLIASGLDDSALIETMQKVFTGRPIDWHGKRDTSKG